MPLYRIFPPGLPIPQAAPTEELERRAIAPEGGPYESRALQRDTKERQRVTFPPYTDEQAATFQDWYEDDLLDGGAWFAATWPMPEGSVQRVRRFLAPPHYEFIPSVLGNLWRISADFEFLGRGLPPRLDTTWLLLHFENNLHDELGQTFAAATITTDGTANRWTYTPTTPKFGAFAAHAEGAAYHANSDVYTDLQVQAQSFQVEGFARPSTGTNMIVFDIGRFHLAGDPGVTTGTAYEKQLEISLTAAGEFTATLFDNGPHGVARVNPAVPTLVAMDGSAWHHWAFCWDKDAGQCRFYVNGALANIDSVHVPGPVTRTPDQRVFLGCRYSGGIPPLQLIALAGFVGDMDEIRGLKGEVTYFGTSITVPTFPFPP